MKIFFDNDLLWFQDTFKKLFEIMKINKALECIIAIL